MNKLRGWGAYFLYLALDETAQDSLAADHVLTLLYPEAGPARLDRTNLLATINLLDFRGYPSLDVAFGPGPHLIWGPNAAGKTSLLEAMVLMAWGRSHRTTADGELVRWGTDLARVEGRVGSDTLEVAVTRAGATGSAGRKRIRVNGLGRRAAGLAGLLRVVVFAPEEMLLIAGSPSLRRAVIDQLATSGSPAYADAFATYGRTLQQRNGLLRAIREDGASRDELRFWDGTFAFFRGFLLLLRLFALFVVGGPAAGQRHRHKEQDSERTHQCLGCHSRSKFTTALQRANATHPSDAPVPFRYLRNGGPSCLWNPNYWRSAPVP